MQWIIGSTCILSKFELYILHYHRFLSKYLVMSRYHLNYVRMQRHIAEAFYEAAME
jgi:hypothetical protein